MCAPLIAVMPNVSQTLRLFSASASSLVTEVRVRFAPSPTGFIHLGGLRTALYNYLFARQNNGSFILRIEDTDRDRVVPNSIRDIENILVWSGLVPDEGPSFGGHYGPYLQSERLHLYKEKAKDLLSSGHAYRCFCSELRLDLLRKEAIKNREIHKYDNRCRFLTEKEINDKLSNGMPYTIRFKLKEGLLSFDDLICGSLSFDLAAIESDPILMKSDGFPTYHLANVVDDHYMKISHVLRGSEWQVSTPKHIMMYEAFGWPPPKYAHLPLILNSDGTKLSKRQQHIQMDYFKDNGYFPEALLNYLTSIGGGFRKPTDDLGEFYSLNSLMKYFDITKVLTNNCKLETEKIKLHNRNCVRSYIKTDIKKLMVELTNLLQSKFGENIDLNDDYLRHLLAWSQDRVFTLNELINSQFMFLWKSPDLNWNLDKIGPKHQTESILKNVIEILKHYNETNFDKENVSKYLQNQLENKFSTIMKYSKIMKLLRLSLTNSQVGPPVAEIMEMLGRERTVHYLSNAYTYVNNFN